MATLTIEDVPISRLDRLLREKRRDLVTTRRSGRLQRRVWSPEADELIRRHYDPRVRGRSDQLARALGVERWVVNVRAARLGLSRVKERPWTEAEHRSLEKLASRRSMADLARRFGRSETAILLKMKRLGLTKKGEGYTARSLAQALGVDDHWVGKRIEDGKLPARRRQTRRRGGQNGDYYLISDDDVVEMVRNHPYEIDLRKVDQYWFMDVIGAALNATRFIRRIQ